MNPFDLAGPQFLVFYVLFATAVCFAVWVLRRRADPAAKAPRLADPYAIAFLRSGPTDTVRAAMVALLHRELLESTGSRFRADPGARSAVPLERAILGAAASAANFDEIAHASAVRAALDGIEKGLAARGLLAGADVLKRRWAICATAMVLLHGVAGVKIAIALSRGRMNILFLLLLLVVASVVVLKLVRHRRTAAGDEVLRELHTLLAPVRRSVAKSASAGNADTAVQLALVAALWGEASMPPELRAPAHSGLWPAKPEASSGGGCGSSCGSGSSSSCGGGCGGGGCGGCGG